MNVKITCLLLVISSFSIEKSKAADGSCAGLLGNTQIITLESKLDELSSRSGQINLLKSELNQTIVSLNAILGPENIAVRRKYDTRILGRVRLLRARTNPYTINKIEDLRRSNDLLEFLDSLLSTLNFIRENSSQFKDLNNSFDKETAFLLLLEMDQLIESVLSLENNQLTQEIRANHSGLSSSLRSFIQGNINDPEIPGRWAFLEIAVLSTIRPSDQRAQSSYAEIQRQLLENTRRRTQLESEMRDLQDGFEEQHHSVNVGSLSYLQIALTGVRSSLRKIKDLSLQTESTQLLEGYFKDLESYLPELKVIPISSTTIKWIIAQARSTIENFFSGEDIAGMTINEIVQYEISSYIENRRKFDTANTLKFAKGMKQRLLWRSRVVDSVEMTELQEQEMAAVISQLQEYSDNNFRASKESLREFHDYFKERFERGREAELQRPQLVRIPFYDDPGDNIYLSAVQTFLGEFIADISKISRSSPLGTIITIGIYQSFFHWFAKLPTNGPSQALADLISKEARKDLDEFSGLGQLSGIIDHRSYIRYYRKKFEELEVALPEQSYTSIGMSVPRRLRNALELFENFLIYLKEEEFETVMFSDYVVVVKTVFNQFQFAQENFKIEGARVLFGEVRTSTGKYIQDLARLLGSNETLLLEKDQAFSDLQSLYDLLEVILRLEDPTFNRSSETVTFRPRDSSIVNWTEKPLSFEDWSKIAPRHIRELPAVARSLQWSLYVLQFVDLPADISVLDRRRARDLAPRFHPDRDHGDADVMSTINAAYTILKLYVTN